MIRVYLILIVFVANFGFAQNYDGTYKVNKIITSDDGDKIFIITNDSIKGIVIMDNDSLKIDTTFVKIKKNKCYNFNLSLDKKKYRGEDDGYAIISSKGKIKRIWNVKKDGKMPLIFTADNVIGLYIKEGNVPN